jgi:hypothetical protein
MVQGDDGGEAVPAKRGEHVVIVRHGAGIELAARGLEPAPFERQRCALWPSAAARAKSSSNSCQWRVASPLHRSPRIAPLQCSNRHQSFAVFPPSTW